MSILKLMAVLGLDGTGFKSGLKEAQGLTSKFSKDVKSQMAGAFGYGALAYAGKQLIDYASSIQDTATALDVSSAALQEQLYWLTQNGGTIEDLTASYKGFSKARAEALSGDIGKQQVFASVGISPEMLKKQNLSQLYNQAAEGFSNTDFGADKMHVATELWGKAATSILPALAQSINNAAKEARMFGQVIREETISTLEKLGDVASQVGGFWKNIGAEVLVFFSRVFTTVAFGLAEIPALAEAMSASIAVSLAKVDLAVAKMFGQNTENAEKNIADAEARLAGARAELDRLSGQHADIYDPNSGTKGKGRGAALLEDAAKAKEGDKIWQDIIDAQKEQDEADKKRQDARNKSLEDRLALEKEIWKVNLQQMSASEKRAAKEQRMAEKIEDAKGRDKARSFRDDPFDEIGMDLDRKANDDRTEALGILSDLLDDTGTELESQRRMGQLDTNPLTAQGQLGGGRREIYAESSPVVREIQKLLPPTQAMKTAMEALNIKVKGTTTLRSST